MPRINDADVLPLVERYRAGDRKAGDELVRACTPVIRYAARKIAARWPSIEFDDAIQVTCLGLLRAADSFEQRGEISFLNYVVKMSRWLAHRHFSKTAYIVRPGSESFVGRVERAAREFASDDEALASIMGDKGYLAQDTAVRALEIVRNRNAVSIDVCEFMPSTCLEDELVELELSSMVRDIVFNSCKSDRDREIARGRILADDDCKLTLKDIGDNWGRSREAVRLRENKLMRRVEARVREELAA